VQAAPPEKELKNPEDVLPRDLDEAQKAHSKMLERQRFTVDALLSIIRDERRKAMVGKEDERYVPLSANYRLQTALAMFGTIRAPEGVEPLLELIDLETRATGGIQVTDSMVIRALAKIGKPASIGAVASLSGDKSKDRARRYVRVIVLVEGVDLGKEMVRLTAEKEKDPAKKDRLQAALELFKDAEKAVP
jgi:hypothetical protein